MAAFNPAVVGARIDITATPTVPGFQVLNITATAAPTDTSFFKPEKITTGEPARGGNADVYYKVKMPDYKVTVALGVFSPEQIQLSNLLLRNSPDGKTIANDNISLTYTAPNGYKAIYTNGKIIEGDPTVEHEAVGSAKIAREYVFYFANYNEVPPSQVNINSSGNSIAQAANALRGLL